MDISELNLTVASASGETLPITFAWTEDWLDELAFGLTEQGWVSHDVHEYLPIGMLGALGLEVQGLHRRQAMTLAGIGRGLDHVTDPSVRRDRIAWLDGVSPPQKALFEFLTRIQVALNKRLFLGLRRFEAHYATYQPGDFYRRHVDSFVGRASRVVSLVLYLNDGWQAEQGGALQIHNKDSDDEVCGTVLPEAGRMVVFLSEEVPHEVLKAQRTRHSIACWFRQDEVPIPL
ncbi:2OG-Fe(II) oxygenase [Marinobacter caseinilyticus]|uniref:2OG-Fe(II) oxygenase n=1 Tax=Marinobacter caseinilyticus TaxID=2692195 RepID=UPI00140E2A99|nr:2OG-Fe(II) oxygenase [Marinobacter caseinilyticus]